MPDIIEDKVSQKIRDIFNKGFAALERGNTDYAIDLFMSCVLAEPSFLQARKYLRAAEIQKLKKSGINVFTHRIAMIANIHLYIMAMLKISKKPLDALADTEKLMQKDPLNLNFIFLLARAAQSAGLNDVVVQELEIALENYPSDLKVLEALGNAYIETGQTRKARECFEKLCNLKPNDPVYIRLLKNAMALDSMKSDKWEEVAEKGGSFREIVKDIKTAVLLEQKDKAFKSDKDIDSLIADLVEKIKNEPQNINYYRALAKYYTQKEMFDEAIATIEKARQVSPGDPELDNLSSSIKVQKFNYEINRLKEAGDTAGVEAKTIERDQFVFDDLQERVKRYPNDLRLRFELGVIFYDNDYFNEAIQQFQLAQRNPKNRLRALYYLGMCFSKKNQTDLAIEQLEGANSEAISMDETKKDILYALGELYERTNDRTKALNCYKQIYQADIAYKDVAAKIEALYQQK